MSPRDCGTWIGRRYLGNRQYETNPVFDFWQAQDALRRWGERGGSPITTAGRIERCAGSPDRPATGLPPHRHADHQSPKGPVQSTALRWTSVLEEFPFLHEEILRRLQERLWLGHGRGIEPRGAEPPDE